MSWVAVAVGVGSVAAAGISAATAPDAPGAPDYARANREAIQADIDTLPLRRMIESAARQGTTVLKDGYTVRQVSSNEAVNAAQTRLSDLESKLNSTPKQIDGPETGPSWNRTASKIDNPAYTQLQGQLSQARQDLQSAISNAGTGGEQRAQYYDKDGNPVSKADAILADFTGYGDIDISRQQLAFQRESADATAASMLELQKKYGPEFIAQRLKELEQSDPTGFALRKTMGEKISAELDQGSKLTPEMRQEVEQATRGAQAARGNVLGAAPAAAEAMEVGNAGYRLWQQRLANAASFLSGSTPVAQFGQISGAQAGASPYVPQNMQAGVGLNPNAGQMGAQFANQQYNTQTSQWATQVQNNPWATFFGSVSGAGLTYGANQLGKT